MPDAVAAGRRPPEPVKRDPTKRNVLLLALCQALFMSASSLIMTVTALVGHGLAADKSLATLPLALQFVATMLTTFPASLAMKHMGRRAGFGIGALCGIAGGGLSAQAIVMGSFALFCGASLLLGIAAGCAFFYRFAAADTASPDFKSRAISLVMGGGVIAAFLGPELAIWSRDLLAPVTFAGGYLAIAALALITLLILQFIEIPKPSGEERHGSGRPMLEIVRQPAFVVAVLCAMVAYGAMSLVMVSTPLAVLACDHSFETAAFVIQWHVVAMYGPSFVTGHAIRRFGVLPILLLGVVLVLGCVAVNLSGVEAWRFWAALVFLGLGWNLMFVGGTTLLTETYRPSEKAKTQALNDFLVFGTVAASALASGRVFEAFGWQTVNLGVVAPLLLVGLAVLWLGRKRHPAAA